MTTQQATDRHFLRCPECLFVWAVEIERLTKQALAHGPSPHARVSATHYALEPYLDAGCAIACGCKRAEDMGTLNPITQRLQIEKVKCECDHACTHARGPDCECPCGGKNHGVGMLADYIVAVDTGKLSVKMKHAPKSAQVAIDRAFQWRAMSEAIANAMSVLDREIEKLRALKRGGTYLNGPQWTRLVLLQRAREKGQGLSTRRMHEQRMKVANELIALAQQQVGGA